MSPDLIEPEDSVLVDNFNAIDEEITFRYSITSYGSEPLVDGLVNRLETEDILIPNFQRGFVWSIEKSSKFIESLLLGLPVPGVFFSRDRESEQFLVIDGHQRLKSLFFFKKGYFKEEDQPFVLTGLKSRYNGATYETLSPSEQRRFNNSIIHATIVQQDEPTDDQSSIYLIFERLNTGGSNLTAHEIRFAIYRGHLNELIGRLNRDVHWRNLFGEINSRMRDQELILRFLALFYYLKQYTPPMKTFLNRYMILNKNLQITDEKSLIKLFSETVQVIDEGIGSVAFRPRGQLNAAICDSIMMGVAVRLMRGPIDDLLKFRSQYEELMGDPEYGRYISANTTSIENVTKRIELAISYFDDVQ